MKKILCLVSILALILLTGCSKSNLNTISLDELYNKISNKDSFVIFFEDEDNGLKTKLEEALSNNNIEGYLIKTSKISAEEKTKLEPIIAYDSNSIVFVVDGKDASILSHVTNQDTTVKEITARLKDMNFIK